RRFRDIRRPTSSLWSKSIEFHTTRRNLDSCSAIARRKTSQQYSKKSVAGRRSVFRRTSESLRSGSPTSSWFGPTRANTRRQHLSLLREDCRFLRLEPHRSGMTWHGNSDLGYKLRGQHSSH